MALKMSLSLVIWESFSKGSCLVIYPYAESHSIPTYVIFVLDFNWSNQWYHFRSGRDSSLPQLTGQDYDGWVELPYTSSLQAKTEAM